MRPDLVAELSFTEWSPDGALRHPSFVGLRADKAARDVAREAPLDESVAVDMHRGRVSVRKPSRPRPATPLARTSLAGLALSHPDKLYFPEARVTKQDLAQYYADVAPAMLPYLRHRPLSLVRCPDGWTGQCFYQKHAPAHIDAAVDRVHVSVSGADATYLSVDSARALVALVQWGVIELHPWGAQARHGDRCDTLIFDLDPHEDVAWGSLVEGVNVLRTLLAELRLTGFLKTTGGKGLHVVVPIAPALPWVQAKAFAKAVATLLARTLPQRFTATMAKRQRTGRIFVDYLRNAHGATAVAPYSVRARKNAPVATPIAWEELASDIRFDHFNVHNVLGRLATVPDPWQAYGDTRQAVSTAAMKRVEMKV